MTIDTIVLAGLIVAVLLAGIAVIRAHGEDLVAWAAFAGFLALALGRVA